ncbi:hypothetical protein [Micromonospora sp. NPDC002575]|uniref:hypothetical protein n=1 Tax=Micromonospora sp. NPDC002575 TaxID=3364222 RepID=UPI0036A415F4
MSGDGRPALPTDHVRWRHDDPTARLRAHAEAAEATLAAGHCGPPVVVEAPR